MVRDVLRGPVDLVGGRVVEQRPDEGSARDAAADDDDRPQAEGPAEDGPGPPEVPRRCAPCVGVPALEFAELTAAGPDSRSDKPQGRG
uniref:hypothetical protein n=1 Tax=Rhodococcus hoagii TaxID=43767 RepID=UPI00155DC6B7|nr:hypothetical protein [Prescottella equi]